MASDIDVTVPVQGNPTTLSVRANFTAAKNEIDALQANAANPLLEAGNSMTIKDTASIVAQDAGSLPTVTITAVDPDLEIDCVAGSAVVMTDNSPLAFGDGKDVVLTPDGTDLQVTGAGNVEFSGANNLLFSGTGQQKFNDNAVLVFGSGNDVTLTPDGTDLQVTGAGNVEFSGANNLVLSGTGTLKANDDIDLLLGTDDDATIGYDAGTQKLAILTKNNTDVAGAAIDLKTGNVIAATVASIDSPDMNIATGGTIATGAVQAGNSGALALTTGATTAGAGTSGDSGNATFGSGASAANSGATSSKSGTADVDSGNYVAGSGNAGGISGGATFKSGDAQNSSGMVLVTSGTSANGNPGAVKVTNGANIGFIEVYGVDGYVKVFSPNWSVSTGGEATFVKVNGPATKDQAIAAATSTPPTQAEITAANGGQGPVDAGDGYRFKLKDTGTGNQWVIYSDGAQWLHGPSLMVAAS